MPKDNWILCPICKIKLAKEEEKNVFVVRMSRGRGRKSVIKILMGSVFCPKCDSGVVVPPIN